jgi:hypothetical protein
MSGELLTLWTIRLALACYVAFVALRLRAPSPPARDDSCFAIARVIWSLGCGLFLVHVAGAFHFYHGWSHAAAWEKTASETDKLLGIRFGDGIYFSYAFTLLWLLDVAAMWLWPRADGALRLFVHAYLFFIAFNGAIVFEAGPIRWVGIAACLLLAGLAGRAAYNWAIERSESRGQRAEMAPNDPLPTDL